MPGFLNPPSLGNVGVEKFEAIHKDIRAMKKVKVLFRKYDLDKNGTLDVMELRNVMNLLGMASGDTYRLIEAAGRNGDGELNIDEFLWWIFSGTKRAGVALERLGEHKVGTYTRAAEQVGSSDSGR
mmetsp:Transcript_90076/g.232489  ORF Transcript_90076/g.232489 Transcript_90076/m.232489 type:complete len:126 (-) Transcript_90076:27-404(-)|eukprot:CAMPEP_0195136272 /NCGR_PEP_ID=MMETSP0448-20130528/153920_1 /TAXON_ID=66468 /ORGANISM="Heterocapsa triquestra, Strain CCMP 448" /LENGTH=125 /DNA_ID=CAMNT_0040174447 /DNA_START=193 /DNA_END=570 /DNA_ORIENTATION=-